MKRSCLDLGTNADGFGRPSPATFPFLRRGLGLVFVLLISWVHAQAEFDHGHVRWTDILKRRVSNGRVDYAALKQAPEQLNRYLAELGNVSKASFKTWSTNQQIAFLINLYNAQTLDLIVRHYPVKSIKDIGSFFKGPWDQPVVRLFGARTTLAKVEHEMLRKDYREPRIHFALVCAALGCPLLRQEAYRAEDLDRQLDEQGRVFLGTSEKNRADLKARTIYLSPVFRWFETDFESTAGTVLDFVRPYFPEPVQEELRQGRFRIRYTDYDWSLNSRI